MDHSHSMKFRHFSSRSLVVLSGFAVGGSLLSDAAFAQAPRTLYLYNATPGRGRGFQTSATASAWGNGIIKQTRQNVDYEGASVQEVTTRNFAEGARFDLREPLDITPYLQQGFLRLRVRFKDAAPVAGAEGGFPGGAPPEGFPGGGFPGGGFPGGGFPGGGFPGGGFQGGGGRFQFNSATSTPERDVLKPIWQSNAQFGPRGGALPPLGGPPFGGEMAPPMDGMGVPTGPVPQSTKITALRVTLVRETGVTMGRIPIDLEATQPDANGWRLLILAVRDMTSTKDAAGPIKRVLLTSDNEDTFFLAQAALAVETGKMTVSIRRSQDPAGTQTGEIEVRPGLVTLVADVEAGTADPNIEWDFDADKVGNLPAPAVNGGIGIPGGEGGFPQPGVFPGMAPPNMGIDGGTTPAFNGPRIDARGLTANFEYPNEEQNYRVEVTVRDKTGQKEPVTASILVKVRG